MEELLTNISNECLVCASGSCCQEGVDLSKEEIRRIVAFNPVVKKPWFGKSDKIYNPEPGFEYETLLSDARCVFQAPDKRCLIYPVRPSHCREFPFEDGKLAEYYEPLCDKANKYTKRLCNVRSPKA